MAAFVSVKENKWVRARVISEQKKRENVAADNMKGRSQREEDKDRYVKEDGGTVTVGYKIIYFRIQF